MQRHMSNKQGNPVFSPAMSSVLNSTEKCRFAHPFTRMIAGMTGSRKTVWVVFVSAGSKRNPPTTKEGCFVLFVMVARVHEIAGNHTNHRICQGYSILEHDTFFDINKRNLMMIDDQMDNAGGDK